MKFSIYNQEQIIDNHIHDLIAINDNKKYPNTNEMGQNELYTSEIILVLQQK